MIDSLSIVSVGGDPNSPANISPPPPWTVACNIVVSGGASVDSLAYQVFPGPLVNIPVSIDPNGDFSFDLSSSDLPSAGTYFLLVYAWDDASSSAMAFRQVDLS